MRRHGVALCLLLCGHVAAAALPVSADGCELTTTPADLDVSAGARRFYVEHDLILPVDLPYIVVYEEANRIDGLQRADEMRDDTCGGRFPADDPVFV